MLSQYKFKTELHAHTSPVSRCSQIPAADMAGIYHSLGYHSLAITNHFDPSALEMNKNEFVEYYVNDYNIVKAEGERLGLNVILGAEVRFCENNNDYLVYGIAPEDLFSIYDYIAHGIEAFYKGFKNDRNVILQAHPFRDGMSLAPVGSVDGIEAFNMHPGHNSRVAVAAKYARGLDMLIVGGTDYHHPGHEGLTAMRSKAIIKDSFELAAVIKSRAYLLDIGGCIVLPYSEVI